MTKQHIKQSTAFWMIKCFLAVIAITVRLRSTARRKVKSRHYWFARSHRLSTDIDHGLTYKHQQPGPKGLTFQHAPKLWVINVVFLHVCFQYWKCLDLFSIAYCTDTVQRRTFDQYRKMAIWKTNLVPQMATVPCWAKVRRWTVFVCRCGCLTGDRVIEATMPLNPRGAHKSARGTPARSAAPNPLLPASHGGRVTNAVGTIFRKILVGTRARPI